MRFSHPLVGKPGRAALALVFLLPLAATAQQVTVSAAASLTDAFKELGARFQEVEEGAIVRFNFAASGVLLQQVSQGAPVDVLATADQETMNRAAGQKLIDANSRRDFAANQVVLIEPLQDGAGVKDLKDLSSPRVKRIAVGKPATVPVGRYTKEVLDTAGLWGTLEAKLVQADSARQVLDYVSRGEVEAGFVYATDAAMMGDKVKVVLALATQTPVTYPIAVVADSRQKALALKFIAFVSDGAGKKILERFGFGAP